MATKPYRSSWPYYEYSSFHSLAVYRFQRDRNSAGNLKVQEVVAGGPADRAGIKVGDVILAVNGRSASNLDEVVSIISSHPGEEIELTVKRGEEEMILKVIPSGMKQKNEHLFKWFWNRK